MTVSLTSAIKPDSDLPRTATAALDPTRFGFAPDGNGWQRPFATLGPVAFTPLSWPHAQAPSYDRINGETVTMDALSFVVELQRRTWGMPPEDLVPVNLLAVLADTGGAVIVAYRPELGFNADGWLGFVIGMGARSGTYVSHMLGVREETRGAVDLGWYLKVLQAHYAITSGHQAMIWTYDPMRGANTRLNIEKLGAVFTGKYRGLTLADIADIPEVTTDTVIDRCVTQPPRLRYRIPGDIDRLTRFDPLTAITWRRIMRAVPSALMTTTTAGTPNEHRADPVLMTTSVMTGKYQITAFATGPNTKGEREILLSSPIWKTNGECSSHDHT